MRRLFLLALLAAAPAHGEIRSAEDCAAAVAADPAAAREDAALWQRTGGGVPARLCEAAALSALGANATAARLLTNLAENPNRAIGRALRAVIFTDAARQWLDADQPDLAAAALDRADALAAAPPDRQVLRARVAAAAGDWPAAQCRPRDGARRRPRRRPGPRAPRRRAPQPGRPGGGARRGRDRPPPRPGPARGAVRDRRGARRDRRRRRRQRLWLELIEKHPDSDLAALARANLQRLN